MLSHTLSFILLTLSLSSPNPVQARPSGSSFSNQLSAISLQKRQGITWDEIKTALEIDASCIPDCAPLLARLTICAGESALSGDTTCFCDTEIQNDAQECLGCIINGVSSQAGSSANDLTPSQDVLEFEQEWNSLCGTDLNITDVTPSGASTDAVVATSPAVVLATTTWASSTLASSSASSSASPYDSSDIGGAHGDYPAETSSATAASSSASLSSSTTTTTTTTTSSSPSSKKPASVESASSSGGAATLTVTKATTGAAVRVAGQVGLCLGLAVGTASFML